MPIRIWTWIGRTSSAAALLHALLWRMKAHSTTLPHASKTATITMAINAVLGPPSADSVALPRAISGEATSICADEIMLVDNVRV